MLILNTEVSLVLTTSFPRTSPRVLGCTLGAHKFKEQPWAQTLQQCAKTFKFSIYDFLNNKIILNDL